MAEVTRVPIKPVSRNSLLMLLLGILIGLAIAAAFAWFTRPAGVEVDEITAGTGASPKPDDVVFVKYVGKLKDGTEFDRSQDTPLPVQGILPAGTPLPLAQMLPGFRDAMVQMKKGGKYTATIPADKAYGASPPPGSPIPANADLTFEIELIDFMTMAEAERRFQVLQQAVMQQQGQAPGGQGGGNGGATPTPNTPPPPPTPLPAPPQ